MSQITGNPSANIGGLSLGAGVSGPLVHLWGYGDPNANTDASITSAALGSLYSRLDGVSATTFLYVKTALPNTWTGK
jgi:hypothetical protein